jgi:hypothetical protein
MASVAHVEASEWGCTSLVGIGCMRWTEVVPTGDDSDSSEGFLIGLEDWYII